MKESQAEKARLIAIKAHEGQRDKQGKAYIAHPEFVADHVSSDIEKAVAWLHDVVEDTDITLTDLESEGFSEEVLLAVAAITKPKYLKYSTYIHQVAKNPIAKTVKIEDLKHNIAKGKVFDIENNAKYEDALKILEDQA